MAKRKSIFEPERISSTIDTELFDALQLYASQNGATMSDVIRKACQLYREVRIGVPEQVAITIDDDLLERYDRYAQITNKTVQQAAKEALEDWMDTVGEGDIEMLTGVPIDSQAERLGLPITPCVPSTTLLH